MPNHRQLILGVLLAVLPLADAAAAALLSRSVSERLRERTVEVISDGRIRGGGAIVSQDGLVVTAAHLLPSAKSTVEMIVPGIGRRPASLVAVDLGRDLALLRISLADGEKLQTLKISEKTPRQSERIFCYGPALRNQPLLLTGMVADDREVCAEYSPFEAYLQCYLVNASAPSLMSGSAWIDDSGEIVGIQNGRLNDDGGKFSGIAMVATPAAIRQLVSSAQDVPTAGLGGWGWELWTAADEHVARYPQGQEGIIITHLRTHGPLDKAGVQLLELITHVDETKVIRRNQFVSLLRTKQPGAKLVLRLRDGDNRERSCTVTLEDVTARWRERAVSTASPSRR